MAEYRLEPVGTLIVWCRESHGVLRPLAECQTAISLTAQMKGAFPALRLAPPSGRHGMDMYSCTCVPLTFSDEMEMPEQLTSPLCALPCCVTGRGGTVHLMA